jgi:MFS transporter, DHA1 family, multidrug resistance protein
MRKRKSVLFGVLLITFFVNFDSAALIPIIANYAVSIGATYFLAGIIVGVYSIVHIPSNIFLGRLIDRVGRKKLLSLGIFLDGVSLLLYVFAETPLLLLIGRIIHGLGGGFGGPATMSYLSDMIKQTRSGRGMALYGISVGLSMLLGFLIGGLMASFIGYKQLFLTISFALFIMTLISVSLPVIYEETIDKGSLQKEYNVFKEILKNSKLRIAYLSIFALFVNLGILTASYSILLNNEGYSDAQIGIFFGIVVIVALFMHYPMGIMSDKHGDVKIIVFGLILISLSFLIFLISSSFISVLLGMIIFGLGDGMIFPITAKRVRDYSTAKNRGLATGVFYSLTVAGIAVGAPISGLIFEYVGGFYLLSFGVLLPLGFLIIGLIGEKRIR